MVNKSNNEEWLKTLQQKLRDYQEPVGKDAWQQMQQKLAASNQRRHIVRRRFSYGIAAAIAALIGISTFFALLSQDVANKTMSAGKAIASTAAESQVVEPVTSTSDDATLNNQIAQVVTSHQKASDNATSNEIQSMNQVSPSAAYNTEASSSTEQKEIVTASNNNQTPPEVVTSKEQASKKEVNTQNKPQKAASNKRKYLPSAEYYVQNKVDRHRPISIGLSVGGAAMPNLSNSSNTSSFDVANGPVTLNNELLAVKSVTSSYSTHSFDHHQPISFGLNVRKAVSKNISAESGVVFTMLVSDVNGSNKKQRLYYVGIPIKGNWTYLKRKQFEMYLTGGGMVEKCIYARLSGEKLKLNKLQFSVSGGTGVAYELVKHLSIYGEAGVSYYFDDGSNIQSIRKDKPCNINLQAGIRLSY